MCRTLILLALACICVSRGSKAGYSSDKVTAFSALRHFPGHPSGKKTKSSLLAWYQWNHSHQVRHVLAVKSCRAVTSEDGHADRCCGARVRSPLGFSVHWMLGNWFHFMTHTGLEGTDHQQPSAGGFFTNSSCWRHPPPHHLLWCCGGSRGACAPLIVPEGLYAHVDCKSDIDCLCSASH